MSGTIFHATCLETLLHRVTYCTMVQTVARQVHYHKNKLYRFQLDTDTNVMTQDVECMHSGVHSVLYLLRDDSAAFTFIQTRFYLK